MFTLKQILKPNIHKLLLFLILLVITPSILGFSSHFIDSMGSELRVWIFIPEFYLEGTLTFLILMIEFLLIFFSSFIIGEIISNKYKPSPALVTLERALILVFGTLGIAIFMAGIIGSQSLYQPEVLFDLSKYVLLSFILALIVESIRLRIKESILRYALMGFFLFSLLMIALFEASVLIS
ncbi:hypothetical protein KY358_06810 [Candidatus Woesearchaeota archaeon]|nr:hypothetical protein [Candidatus Woesearchaeota archaeon]